MSDKIPDIVDYSVDFPEIDYDFAEAHYIGDKKIDCGPYEFSEPYYLRDDGLRYSAHYVISEVNEDGSLKTDVEMHQRLIEWVWMLVVDYYDLATNLAGEFNAPVDAIDEYIDECYDEVNYYLGKAPLSRVLYYLDQGKYVEIAYDFVVSLVQEVMYDLAVNGVAEVADFKVILKKY